MSPEYQRIPLTSSERNSYLHINSPVIEKKIKGLKGHNGIKPRKYRLQETIVLEAEFSSKSSKSGRGLSGMDTPSKTLRFYYILALKKCSNNHPHLPTPTEEKIGLCQTNLTPPLEKLPG